MRLMRLALLGAAFAVLAMLAPQASFAGSLASSAARQGIAAEAVPALKHLIFHGHASRATSMYCYPRNYWWFYRPYTTAAENYPRCMPYFHYPPEAYRRRSGPSGMK
jgi:hypothetical protein